MRRSLNWWFFLLIFASEASAWVRAAGGNAGLKAGGQASAFSSGNGDPVLLALNAFVILVTVIICFPKLKEMAAMLLHERVLLAIYFYSLLSVFWSANIGNSFRVAVYLIFGLLQFAYIGLYMDAEEQVESVGTIVSFLAILSYIGQFTLRPADDPAPGWTGIFLSKNYLGNVMAIGIIALLLQRGKFTVSRVSKLLLCLALLVLSQSFTSVLCVTVAVCVLVYLRLNRQKKLLLVGTLSSTLLLVAVLLPNFLGLLLGASGKDLTLTGRDVIWAFAIKYISYRPFLGYGYYGFWISQEDAALEYLGWNPKQAHNGFLDLALNEGLVGVGILLFVFLVGVRRSLQQIRAGDTMGAGRWLLIMFFYLVVHNVSEADFYQRPAWVVFLAAYVASAKADLPVVATESDKEIDGSTFPMHDHEIEPALT